MAGYPGDDQCSDCAWPWIKAAREGAAKAVEDAHFKATGERKSCGAILRKSLGIE
jgi:hypothetical protein